MELYERLKSRQKFNTDNQVNYGVYVTSEEVDEVIDVMQYPKAISNLNNEAIRIVFERLQYLEDEIAIYQNSGEPFNIFQELGVLNEAIVLLDNLMESTIRSYSDIINDIKIAVISYDHKQSQADLNELKDMVVACSELQEAAEKKVWGVEQ